MIGVFEPLCQASPNEPLFRRKLAMGYFRAAECLCAGVGRSSEIEQTFGRARALQEALVRAYPEEPTYTVDLARTLRSLGNFHVFMTHDHAIAERTLLAARARCSMARIGRNRRGPHSSTSTDWCS